MRVLVESALIGRHSRCSASRQVCSCTGDKLDGSTEYHIFNKGRENHQLRVEGQSG